MPIVLVDASHLLHRVSYIPALANLTSQDLKPSGLVHGFFKSIISIRKHKGPFAKFIVCWDKSGSQYRDQLFTEYKSNRYTSLGDEDRQRLARYNSARQLIMDGLGILRIPSIQIHGIEADDIIAYLSRLNLGDRKVIVSDDADLLQLVSPDTDIFRQVADKYYDLEGLIKEYNLNPKDPRRHLVMIKAMVGDKSDNISGIPTIGDKTATKIASDIIDGKTIEPSSAKNKAFLDHQDLYNRNLKLVDLYDALETAPDMKSKIRDSIASVNALMKSPYSTMEAIRFMRSLELKQCLQELVYLEDIGLLGIPAV